MNVHLLMLTYAQNAYILYSYLTDHIHIHFYLQYIDEIKSRGDDNTQAVPLVQGAIRTLIQSMSKLIYNPQNLPLFFL